MSLPSKFSSLRRRLWELATCSQLGRSRRGPVLVVGMYVGSCGAEPFSRWNLRPTPGSIGTELNCWTVSGCQENWRAGWFWSEHPRILNKPLEELPVIFILYKGQGTCPHPISRPTSHGSITAPAVGSCHKASPPEISRWAAGINLFIPLQVLGPLFSLAPES